MGHVSFWLSSRQFRWGRCVWMAAVFVAGLVLTLTEPAFAIEPGQTVTGSVELGGRTLPLPPGEWTVYFKVEENGEKFANSKLGLVLISGKAIKQTAYFRTIRSKKGAGFKPYELCAQPYYFHSETAANQVGGAQDCWHVQAETLAPDNQSDRQEAITAFAKSRGLFLPLVVIGTRYHRADQKLLLQAAYGWSPDLILKAPADLKAWRFQDWTAESVARDPRKRVIMSKFKRWGEEWRPKIGAAFSATSGAR